MADVQPSDAAERALFASIAATPMAMIITNARLPDNPIVAVNDAFVALTGYAREETVGRNCRFLAGKETDRACSRILHDAIEAGRPAPPQPLHFRQDGP